MYKSIILKILFVTDGLFPFQIGGMQKHSSVLVKHLARPGVEVTVIHPTVEGESEVVANHFENHPNLRFVSVPFSDTGRLPGHYIRANKRYSRNALEAVKQVLEDFDIVYAQGFTGRAFIELRKKNQLKAPVLVNLHGFEMFQPAADLKHKIAYALLKREASFNLKNADYVYSFGAKLSQLLTGLGIPKEQILEQSNGIETSWIRTSPPITNPVRTFIFIGRNERRKGMTELVAAIQQLQQQGKEFRVHFIGDIDATDRLNHPDLIYHGVIRDVQKIQSILDSCDCLVIPSHSEGMPTVILEAMARGLAILGTNVGAVSRMIDGNGIMIEKPEAVTLASAMKQFIEMPSPELDQFKKQSLELIKNFRWSEIAEQKLRDFEKILKQR